MKFLLNLLYPAGGENPKRSVPKKGIASASGQFDGLFGNPSINHFEERRNRILGFDGELVSAASLGDHERLVALIEKLLAEVNLCNSNVSRFVATPIKTKYPNTDKSNAAQSLYTEHNKVYIEIRRLCKQIITKGTLLATGDTQDDFQIIDETQSADVFTDLDELRDAIRELEKVWKLLAPLERESEAIRNQKVVQCYS